MKFNINNNVRVKLTDRGRELLKADHEQAVRDGDVRPKEYQPPKEDENGWSTWQMWVLMEALGKHMCNGMDGPIETEIEILDRSQPEELMI